MCFPSGHGAIHGHPWPLRSTRPVDQPGLLRQRQDGPRDRRPALRAELLALRGAGVGNLHLLAGEPLLGPNGDDTVDGSHPNDLGFARHAAAFEKKIRAILGR